MDEPNMHIDVTIRVVGPGEFMFSVPYGSDNAVEARESAAKDGQMIQVGSSAIAPGLSIPVSS